MKIRTALYCLKQGLVNIKRNKLFSLASISTIAACVFLIGMFYTIVVNFQYIVKSAEDQVGITIFFNEGIDQAGIDAIGAQIAANDKVANYTFTSAEEAWDNFKVEYFKQNEDLAEGFKDDNPLANSASYTVYLKNIEDQKSFSDEMSQVEGVRTVNYSEGTVSAMTSFGRLVGYASVAIIVVLLAVGIFLISNTVMIGISVRKKEIKVMKLIGASNIFVRAPFVIEGIVIGLVGATIPLVLIKVLYEKVVAFVMQQFSALSSIIVFLPQSTIFAVLVPMGLGIGAGIGFVGSILSIRKHLKV